MPMPKESVCAETETISKHNLEEMLKDCRTPKEVIELSYLLTKKQQEDKDISKWFKLRKLQLEDELKLI